MATAVHPSADSMLEQLVHGGIKDPCVIAAMTEVPRDLFGPVEQACALARMIEALRLGPDDRVLEIGTGSGYATAVLSRLASHVYSIDASFDRTRIARDRLAALAYDGIDIRCSDGALGWPEHAPFEAIIAWTELPDVPGALVDQLAVGGRLVMSVGRRLAVLAKTGKNRCDVIELGARELPGNNARTAQVVRAHDKA